MALGDNSPAIANGIVKADASDAQAYAFDSLGRTLSFLNVSCSPSPAFVGSGVICTATVSGSNPTGTVNWTTTSNMGVFSNILTPLISGNSSTIFTETNSGIVSVMASYSGDSNNSPSGGGSDLLVRVNPESWTMFHNGLDHSGYSTSSGPSTSQTLWTYGTGSFITSSPAVAGGVVYIGTGDKWVYALDAFTGAKLWGYQTDGSVISCPAVANGVVYVGSWDGRVYALNAYTGAKLWSYQTGSNIESSPAVANGVVFIGSYDASVYALNASTGARLWNYATGSGAVRSSPAVVGGTVYVGASDGTVYALNANTGLKLWSYIAGDIVCSSPAVVNSVVYIGGDTSGYGSIYALNASTGSKIWNYKTDGSVFSSPAIANGVIYVGSSSNGGGGQIYALSVSSGDVLWNFPTSGVEFASPAVTDGSVYIGGDNGTFFAFGTSIGNSLWSYQTGGSVGWSSPAIADGVVYVGSSDGNVYAFGSSTPPHTPSPTITPTPSPTPSPTPTEQPINTQCTLSAAPNPVQIYQNVHVNMSVIPAPPTSSVFNNITFSITRPDGTVINNLLNSNSDGSLNLSFTSTENGIWTLSLNFPGQNFANNTLHYLPSRNQTTLITLSLPTPTPTPTPTPSPILPSPGLSFDCISSTTNSGFNVEIHGTLTYNGTAISYTGIQLSFSVTAGSTWQDLAYVNTDDNGSFSVVWLPSASGNYIIKATCPANSVYSDVSATNNFAIAPFNNKDQNIFSVTSNSTLTSLIFDSTTNELNFGVSGTTGTTGYTQVCIPKSLISDISKLNVILDNATINYNSFSEGNNWIVTFTYHHSSHIVVIALGATPTTTPSTSPTVAPTVTPTVTPTTAPKSTIAPSATSQPTQLTPTSSPATVPEFPSVALLLFIMLAISSVVILGFKNRKLNKNETQKNANFY